MQSCRSSNYHNERYTKSLSDDIQQRPLWKIKADAVDPPHSTGTLRSSAR